MSSSPLRLCDLPNGAQATVLGVSTAPTALAVDAQLLRRLGDLGFLPGEPVQVMRRGPGGREPIAVQVGETLFALRRFEAQCVEVSVPQEGAGPLASLLDPLGGPDAKRQVRGRS